MADGHDPIASVRTYACRKSQLARDRWLAGRAEAGMPVFRIADKHGEPPGAFMRQFQKAQK
jgi:hypothetical protein